MNETKTNQIDDTGLSEAEWLEERTISERTLAFLQAQIEALTPHEQKALLDRVNSVLVETITKVRETLARMPEIKFKNPGNELRITPAFHYPNEAFAAFGESSIEWGRADVENDRISILSVALLAPKDVLRALVVHEVMHLAYAKLETTSLPVLPVETDVQKYPLARQQEEQWVRDMTKRLGYVEKLVEMWEVSIELQPENWRPLYYRAKKDLLRKGRAKKTAD